MKTRVEIWRKYRREINSSIELQKAVTTTNEKLSILNKRLLEVVPDYNQKYKFELKTIEPNFTNEAIDKKHFSTQKVNDLLQVIEDANLVGESFNAISQIDFSSHEVDDIISEIKSRSNQVYGTNNFPDKSHNNQKPEALTKKIQVAIDGPSGSGKSTIAKAIAIKYGLKYVNTGLFYRAIAFNALLHKADLTSEKAVLATLHDGMIELHENEQLFLNGRNMTTQLATNEIAQAASKISIHRGVRNWVVTIQKQYAVENKVIMDGRDTTFKVMPHANIKIFLETSTEERARRRLKDNKAKGFKDNFETVLKEIKERDHRDQNREFDPLHKTEDAHLINSTDLAVGEVVAMVSRIIDRELQNG